MLEPGGGANLAQKPLGTEIGGQLRPENLQCDQPFVPKVLGQIDGGHTATAQLPLDLVAISKRRFQASSMIDQTTTSFRR